MEQGEELAEGDPNEGRKWRSRETFAEVRASAFGRCRPMSHVLPQTSPIPGFNPGGSYGFLADVSATMSSLQASSSSLPTDRPSQVQSHPLGRKNCCMLSMHPQHLLYFSILPLCFRHRADLIVHRRTHTGEMPYHCSECRKCFEGRSTLIRHERLHTRERPCKCAECGKSFGLALPVLRVPEFFSNRSSLIRHQRRHTDEKPYKCHECEKSFGQSSDLIAHQRTHTGERPYLCPVCGKWFSRKSNLVIHQRVHRGDTLCQCQKCGKSLQPNSTLLIHQDVVLEENAATAQSVRGASMGRQALLNSRDDAEDKNIAMSPGTAVWGQIRGVLLVLLFRDTFQVSQILPIPSPLPTPLSPFSTTKTEVLTSQRKAVSFPSNKHLHPHPGSKFKWPRSHASITNSLFKGLHVPRQRGGQGDSVNLKPHEKTHYPHHKLVSAQALHQPMQRPSRKPGAPAAFWGRGAPTCPHSCWEVSSRFWCRHEVTVSTAGCSEH
uniref:C2H2-type domain-containing protein n=1 Tax=Apteryx owenii TaxID=8824 RepID=A0A8B9QEF8_APTOW